MSTENTKRNFTLTSLLIIAIVCGIIYFAGSFISSIFNPINRVYDSYDKICSIRTNYADGTIDIFVASNTLIDPTIYETRYKLDDLNKSKFIILDNSVALPTMQDNILHIPDTYPK